MPFLTDQQQRNLRRLVDVYSWLTQLISSQKVHDLTLTNVQIGILNLKLAAVIKEIKAITALM